MPVCTVSVIPPGTGPTLWLPELDPSAPSPPEVGNEVSGKHLRSVPCLGLPLPQLHPSAVLGLHRTLTRALNAHSEMDLECCTNCSRNKKR